jgi:hypothetical protein
MWNRPMAKIWACYNNDASKPWGELPVQECERRLHLSPVDYLCSSEQFGPRGRLQTEPDHTHVVIEVSQDEVASGYKPGIYRLGMTPAEVHRELGLP